MTVLARISSLPWLVVSERGEQFTRQGNAYIIREAGTRAKLRHVWPHMLRHSCGYQKSGARPQAHPGLSRAQEHQEYHALHTHERGRSASCSAQSKPVGCVLWLS